jgi:hypothetical protein
VSFPEWTNKGDHVGGWQADLRVVRAYGFSAKKTGIQFRELGIRLSSRNIIFLCLSILEE